MTMERTDVSMAALKVRLEVNLGKTVALCIRVNGQVENPSAGSKTRTGRSCLPEQHHLDFLPPKLRRGG